MTPPGATPEGEPTACFSQTLETSLPVQFALRRTTEGGDLARPPHRTKRKNLPALGCYSSGDLVEGRVANLIGFNLRSSLNDSRQDLHHFWIGPAVVSFRVLCPVPQTNSERFLFPRGDERDLVLEPGLFSKQGNDFLLQPLCQLRNAVRLQMHGHFACKHVNLLGCRGQGPIIRITPFSLDYLMTPSVR